MAVIQVEISSFRGWSIGAAHFYGKLRPSYWSNYDQNAGDRGAPSIDLSYIVEQKHVDKMREISAWNNEFDDWLWHVGAETMRFFNKADIYVAACAKFREVYDANVDILVDWDDIHHWNIKKNHVLSGNEALCKQIESMTDERAIETLLRAQR